MKKSLLFSILFFISTITYSQVAETVTTRAVMNEISNSLTQIVNESMARFDYSVAKAAMEGLSLLDAWKETNSHLLDKAFSGLDNQSRNILSRIDALSKEVNSDIEKHISNVNEIVVKANQITENLPFSSKRTFILDYTPKVIFPTNKTSILFQIKGVNLDKSKAKYQLKNGDYIDLDITGPTSASLELPVSELAFNTNSPQLIKLSIHHETRDGSFLFIPKFSKVERKLILSSLPSNFGSFELTGERTFEAVERKIYESDAGRFEGKNKNVLKIAKPLEGYKWDLRNGENSRREFEMKQYGGEAARCQVIVWNESTENGLSLQARCDQIREVNIRGIRWKAGYVSCGVKGPVYRIVQKTEAISKNEGEIEWNIDKSITIPTDLKNFQLKVKMYDGTVRIITNDYADGVLRVIKNSNNIIIRTNSPSSF